jgi:(5-formylfuran-3-yl)methyl phosphate synthase
MRLLVSLRSADEVAAALTGEADIIDAKEPAHGSLGPVAPEVLREIVARVPKSMPLSVALGDFRSTLSIRAAIAAASLPPRTAPVYLKLGFAGESSGAAVTALVSAALDTAARISGRSVAVPVAYADWERAGSPVPEVVLSAAIAAGARAILLDTCYKDDRRLFDWVGLEALGAFTESARNSGLLVAVAGSLDLEALDLVTGLADVIGVRGAACRGGRHGKLDAALVRRLKQRLQNRPALAAE